MSVYDVKTRAMLNASIFNLLLGMTNIIVLLMNLHFFLRMSTQIDTLINRIDDWTNETIIVG